MTQQPLITLTPDELRELRRERRLRFMGDIMATLAIVLWTAVIVVAIWPNVADGAYGFPFEGFLVIAWLIAFGLRGIIVPVAEKIPVPFMMIWLRVRELRATK